jgi:hypothetical protein
MDAQRGRGGHCICGCRRRVGRLLAGSAAAAGKGYRNAASGSCAWQFFKRGSHTDAEHTQWAGGGESRNEEAG